MSARIERLALRLLPFHFTVLYQPGISNIADPLSRLCTGNSGGFVNDAVSYVYFVARGSVPRAMDPKEVENASDSDSENDSVLTTDTSDSINYSVLTTVRFDMKTGT